MLDVGFSAIPHPILENELILGTEADVDIEEWINSLSTQLSNHKVHRRAIDVEALEFEKFQKHRSKNYSKKKFKYKRSKSMEA